MTSIPGQILTITPAAAHSAAPARVGQVPDSPTLNLEIIADIDAASATSALELLAHWWSRPLPEELDSWLTNSDLARQVGSQMGTPDTLAWDTEDALGLLNEYERLFVGPGPVPCPPYESFWRDDVAIDLRYGLMGPCTAEVRDLYEQLGLELKASTGELPDHLPIELEALAYALERAESGDVVRSLFFDHVGKWLPWFCKAVEREAEHDFYRDLAGMTRAWLPAIEHYLAKATRDPGAG